MLRFLTVRGQKWRVHLTGVQAIPYVKIKPKEALAEPILTALSMPLVTVMEVVFLYARLLMEVRAIVAVHRISVRNRQLNINFVRMAIILFVVCLNPK